MRRRYSLNWINSSENTLLRSRRARINGGSSASTTSLQKPGLDSRLNQISRPSTWPSIMMMMSLPSTPSQDLLSFTRQDMNRDLQTDHRHPYEGLQDHHPYEPLRNHCTYEHLPDHYQSCQRLPDNRHFSERQFDRRHCPLNNLPLLYRYQELLDRIHYLHHHHYARLRHT